MKTVFKKILVLFAGGLLVVSFVGCGPTPGTEGDANDPATTDDTEQMEDETGEV
ncbi:MAG: hypothetical protein R3C53_08050 [Pirellulaceae bacterium]